MIFDNAKIRRLVPQFSPRIPFAQGAREIVAWHDADPARAHLIADGALPERWVSQEADPSDGSGPIRLRCYWTPLAQGHALAAGQGALLGSLAATRPTS